MILYFVLITYGIYFATVVEFIALTDIICLEPKEPEIYDFFLIRQPWNYFAVYAFFLNAVILPPLEEEEW